MPEIFDDISRIVGSQIPRRQALKLITGALAGSVLSTVAPAFSVSISNVICPGGNSCGTLDQCCTFTDGGLFCCELVEPHCCGPKTGKCCVNAERCCSFAGGDSFCCGQNEPHCCGSNPGTCCPRPCCAGFCCPSAYPNCKNGKCVNNNAVEFVGFTATHTNNGVLLKWQTGHEVDNLGFNIYRDERNNRTRITPQLIAGSALIAGPGTTLTAGDSYSWLDASTNVKQNASYWLEDIDLNGQSNWHGPFVIKPSVAFNLTSGAKQRQSADQQQAATLASLGTNVSRSQSAPTELRAKLASVTPARLSAQAYLAAQRAIKLSVKQSGWYRVSAQELFAAGLGANPDPRLLQMYVDGQEVPIGVTGQNSQRFDSTSAIEFYGIGLDAAYSDARVYWLIVASQPGKRITATPDEGLSIYDRKQIDYAPRDDGEYLSGPGFSNTIERKDKTVFFQGLNNGEDENFFGPAITNAPVDQALAVEHLDQTVPALATLQVTLQGLTTAAHRVTVSLNAGYLGVVSFEGQAKGTAEFSVLQSTLRDGNNVVTLVAQDGGNDVSLVEAIRLTYQHAYTADNDGLRLSVMAGQPVTIDGFSTSAIHVIDVTNPDEVLTVSGEVRSQNGNVSREMTKPDAVTAVPVDVWPQNDRLPTDLIDPDAAPEISGRLWSKLRLLSIEMPNPDAAPKMLERPQTASPSIVAVKPKALPAVPGGVPPQNDSFSITAAANGFGPRNLLAFTESQIKSPAAISAHRPCGLRKAGQAADLIIITRRNFFDSVEPLAAFRRSQGLKTIVVETEDIYDEFSFGHKTPFAVRNFLAFARTNWKQPPRFVLFVGDASFDPKNYLGLGEFDLVPTKLVATQDMETASDDWFADFNEDGLAEMAVGRLPSRTPQEARTMVTKIIGYERSLSSKNVLLVADTNEGFDFESADAELKKLIPTGVKVKEINRGSTDATTAKAALLDAINKGQTIVNYSGHGAIGFWRGNLLTSEDARGLTNTGQLSVFVMMTCWNGFFHDAFKDSLAEALMKAEQGGAVAVWASSGLTDPVGQAAMNQELYRLLFKVNGTGGAGLTLGEATQRAKASISDIDIRRSWILFGDPTTKLKN